MDRADGQTVSPDPAIMPASRRHPWGGWLIACAACATFANALANDFVFDDVAIIPHNPAITEGPGLAAWTTPYWPGSNQGDSFDVLYRPLTIWTYWLQWRIAGDAPWTFHLVNVLLNMAVSLAVWRLALRLGAYPHAALFAGLLFAVHPLHADVVANVVGRAELLSAAGLFFGILAADAALRRPPAPVGRVSWQAVALWIAAWTLAAAALLAKENGVAALVALPLLGVLHGRLVPADVASAPLAWRRGAILLAPAAILFLAYLAVRYEVCADRLVVVGQRVAVSNPLRDADLVARLLTPPALLGRFVVLMVWPYRLLCDYSINVLPPLRSVADPTFWIGVSCIVAVIVGLVRARHRAVWTFLAVGFVASYFVASNTLLLIDVIFAERLLYAPSAWVCLALAVGLSRARTAFASRPAAFRSLAAAVLVVFTVRAAVRTGDWRTTERLFAADLAAQEPGHRSALLCAGLGQMRAEAGRYADAERLLLEAIALYPYRGEYHRNLGRLYLATGRPQEAVAALERAHTIERHHRETQALLEQARMAAAGRDAHAEYEAARQQARQHPHDVERIRRWARLAETLAPDEAVEAYARLTELEPDEPDHWSGLALAQYGTGERQAAASTYRRIIQRWADDWNAHANLALLYMDRTHRGLYDPQAALAHARRAVELNPTHWQLRVNLAEVTARCGDSQQAADLFEDLAERCPPGSDEQALYRDRARHLRRR